ncbi:MAG: hypothetical protein SXA11_07925 [Cyanobacteriota bacterium]|nr:hypothetical protein [Cyanobacteriota bacterium]
MSDYSIVFASAAEKQLASLPVEIRSRIDPKIASQFFFITRSSGATY